jgi:hypothetical protein
VCFLFRLDVGLLKHIRDFLPVRRGGDFVRFAMRYLEGQKWPYRELCGYDNEVHYSPSVDM